MKNAVATYEITVITAAGEIVVTVTEAVQNIGNEVITVVDIAENAIKSSIECAENGIDAIVNAMNSIVYDATHGEYVIKNDSYYVDFGSTTYVDALAEALGLGADQYAQYDLSDLYKAVGADLITVKFDNSEFVNFIYNQTLGMIATIINDSVVGEMINNNPTFGPVLKDIIATYGLDLNANVEELDWSKFDGQVIEVKDKVLASIEKILRDQNIPEEYVIDLGPKVMEIVNEGLSKPMVTGLEIELEIPVLNLLLDVAETALYVYLDFAVEFPAVLNEIRAIAPDAQIVVLGMDDLMLDMLPTIITENVDVSEYSQYVDDVIDALNLHFFAYALINANVTYVENDTLESVLEALTVTYELLGDVDGDCDVDLDDALLMQQYVAKLVSEEDLDLSAGDVDGDNRYTLDDALLIQQYVAKIIAAFPAEI